MLLRNLFEAISKPVPIKTAVLGWGRGMGHKGHMLLAKAVLHHARENSAKPYFVVSRTSIVDPSTGQPWTDKPTFTKTKDDPLTPEEKLRTYRKVFPQHAEVFTVPEANATKLEQVIAKIAKDGFKKVILVVGQDQKDSMGYLIRPDKSGIPPYQQAGLQNLEIISRQDTKEPSSMRGSPEYQEGPRATPMRQILLDPSKSEDEQFAVWRRDMPDDLSDEEVLDLMRKAKQRMSMVPASKKSQAIKESLQDKIKAIAALNNIADVNKINAGQVLKLPGGGTYKVVYGDTLSQIASKLNFPTTPSRPATAPSLGAPTAVQAPGTRPPSNPGPGRSAGVGGATAKELDDYEKSKNASGVRPGPNPNIDQATRDRALASVKPSSTVTQQPNNQPQSQTGQNQPSQSAQATAQQNIPANAVRTGSGGVLTTSDGTPVTSGDLPDFKAIEAAKEKLTPSQLRWLGDSDPTDPAIMARMPKPEPGEKPVGGTKPSTADPRDNTNPTDARLATGKQTAPADAKTSSKSNLDRILQFTSNTGSRQNFDKLQDTFQEKVEAAAAEYFEKTGKKLQINSAVRDAADQQRLWDISVANGTPGKMPNGFPVAKPKPGGGGSDHERGVAIDIQQGINDPVAIQILKKYGLFQTVAGDPVHFTEPKGGNTAPPPNVVRSSDGSPVRSGSGGYVTSGETKPGTDKPIQSIRGSGPGFIEIITPDGEVQRREGRANWRMNNPGNIRVSDWTKRQPGFIGVGDAGSSGKFAVFSTLADGIRAKKNLLFGPGSSYINLSIKKAIERYAPESDGNKTSSYIDRVVQATKASPDTLLSQLSASQREAMFDTINKVEGFQVGKIQTVQTAVGEGNTKEKPKKTWSDYGMPDKKEVSKDKHYHSWQEYEEEKKKKEQKKQVAVGEDIQVKISNLISILETKHRK